MIERKRKTKKRKKKDKKERCRKEIGMPRINFNVIDHD